MKFDLIDWSAQDLHCFDELAPLLHTERGSGGLPLRLRKADTPGCMMQNGEARFGANSVSCAVRRNTATVFLKRKFPVTRIWG